MNIKNDLTFKVESLAKGEISQRIKENSGLRIIRIDHSALGNNEKNFPEKLERDFEKEKLMNVSINEINWDGETFEFKVDGKNFNDDDKLVIAYILAKAVQKEHDLNEAKIDIKIISGDHKKNVIF